MLPPRLGLLLAGAVGGAHALITSVGANTYSCNTILTEPFGHIESENGNYENHVDTCWLLQPTGMRSVTVSFKSFDTEPYHDVLLIFDGADTNAPRVQRRQGFHGSTMPNDFTSAGGSVLFIFSTDFSMRGKGFTFAWTSSDGRDLGDDCALGCTESKRSNGICDDECYNRACAWDAPSTGMPGGCDQVCNMTTGCLASEAADFTCDARCINQGCGYDVADCLCANVITEPFGYWPAVGSAAAQQASYAPALDGTCADPLVPSTCSCWLLQPTGEYAGRRIALTFARFDTERRFDYVEVRRVALASHRRTNGWPPNRPMACLPLPAIERPLGCACHSEPPPTMPCPPSLPLSLSLSAGSRR